MPMTFAILGAGAWGTAIARHLAELPSHHVRLWCARPTTADELRSHRENRPLLPGVTIPDSVEITADFDRAVAAADVCVGAVPTVHMRSAFTPFAGKYPATVPWLSLAKGVEIETFLRPTQIAERVLKAERLAVLSGPSHAEEVSRGLPTSLVAASADSELAHWVQTAFTSERFRVYTNADVIGVELAGALKNVVGIAAGICDGLGFGDNAKAALLTRGLVEMARFGIALGAEHATFYGLAGVGDLMTTCFSPHGRNRRVGQRLAAGESLADILSSTTMVAEGVYTTRSVYERTLAMGVEMPILSEVYRVLYQGKPPLQAVSDLMLRRLSREQLPT
ncbi:MAG TPA: NAD(P)H-dependent glycerol-3-phosphate dehydrogenase [Gemmataceae bacterium]|jgi:glycerol-3-phosphate dehydrogenase (NAD(P)+)|nr:NAD(P)H-dependent glycerol-3-phosphate dehydrogenase [Gemmataceae bacterium]